MQILRVQPTLRRPRPIGQDLRPERPLDYARLTIRLVITRAKAGDRRALDRALRPRLRGWSASRDTCSDPEDARDASQEALAKLCAKLGAVPRRVGVLDLDAPTRRINACRDVTQRQLARRCEPLDDDARASDEPGAGP